METQQNTSQPPRCLSVLDVWAMAFGCMVGWGTFVMPGTTFLPVAGPAGTVIAMVIGICIMLVIGCNLAFFMNRRSQFLFNMSHDIRTPMNAIVGYTELAMKLPASDELHDYLVKIERSNHQLLTLINDILEPI